MAEDFINPFEPEENEQDRTAKFEDLTSAAQLEQLNAVKDKFIADNKEDTQRGFIEITDISFVRQDNGKELYIVSIKETNKETSEEIERDEYYTIDAQTASLANIKQYSQQEIEQLRIYDEEKADELTKKQEELAQASESTEKISASDLEKAEKVGEELGISEEEMQEEDSYEMTVDSVKFSADKMPSGTDSREIKGNQLLDNNTTLNDLIGKNYQAYKLIKTSGGQKIIIGLNADGSFEPVDSNTLEIINEPTINLMAEDGKKLPDPVAVAFAFRVRQYPTKVFGVYNRGSEYRTFYAEGGNKDGHMLAKPIDTIEPNCINSSTKDIFMQGDANFTKSKENAENPEVDEQDEIMNERFAPEFLTEAEAAKLQADSKVSTNNWNTIYEKIVQRQTNSSSVNLKKEFITELLNSAVELDTIDQETANKLAKEYQVEDSVKDSSETDEKTPEPDEPERTTEPRFNPFA